MGVRGRDFHIGWQVGITYGSSKPEGNSLTDMIRLLNEMASNGMNYLSLMMTSYSFFDPLHDGLCWPTNNDRLLCLRDDKCLNADERSEFISEVITEAKKRGIGIQLFTNLSIYNPDRVRISYPEATLQKHKNGEVFKWLFCPMSKDVELLENDEIESLMSLYNQENVKSISYERLSFAQGSCYCQACEDLFRKDTNKSIFDYEDGDSLFDEWKINNMTMKIKAFNQRIKMIKPAAEVWVHSSLAEGWGHHPDKMKEAKVDCIMPHIAHFETGRQKFNELLERMAPNDMVLQMCVRDKVLQNYPIWEKNPMIIKEIGEWICECRATNDRLKGVLFFNENNVSDANRKAVYNLVQKLRK